jgi:glutamate-1-semialdehyde 2,1-aminomutase
MDVVEHSPPHLVQAIGARVWSDDGAEYVDFDNAGGAVLLGHRDPAVIAAVRMARSVNERRGLARYEKEVAERIADMAPGMEACAFGGEVSQALRAAATAARRHTGRDQVLVCRGAAETGGARLLAGHSFPFDDLGALERLMDLHGDDAAALVLAPCAGRAPSPGYLQGVRALRPTWRYSARVWPTACRSACWRGAATWWRRRRASIPSSPTSPPWRPPRRCWPGSRPSR